MTWGRTRRARVVVWTIHAVGGDPGRTIGVRTYCQLKGKSTDLTRSQFDWEKETEG